MEHEEITEQFDALLAPSLGMRFVIVYMWALIAVLALGSLVVLRMAFVSGDWIIAVPVPLMFLLVFAFLNEVKGVQLRYQSSRRAATTFFWVCGAFSFIFGVWCVAVSVRDFDVDELWGSLALVLLSLLSVGFAACNVFCAIYLEEADGAHRYFGGAPRDEPTRHQNLQRGSPFGKRGFGPFYR